MSSGPGKEYPLILQWDERQPLRTCLLKPRAELPVLQAAPPWHPTGPDDRPFDFCAHVRRLLEDVVERCEELRHVQVDKILFNVIRARNGRGHGLQARVTPLRFTGGELQRVRRGVIYQVQRVIVNQHEYLYLMSFCLPRFLNQSFDDKFVTLFHELFHLGPNCDGDLRRHEGRYSVHTHSQKSYDKYMAHLARAYLATQPEPYLHAFLRLNFAQLCHRHGSVKGIVIPQPKIIPILAPGRQAAREG